MIWTRRIADEFWSGPVTPFTFSLLAETMAEQMVRRPLRLAGETDLAALPVLLRHASHVYVNADLLAGVIGLLPAPLRSAGLLALLPPESQARLPTGVLAAGIRASAIATRMALRERDWLPWRRAIGFERACVELRATFTGRPRPAPDTTAADLDAEIVLLRTRLGEYLSVVSWGMVYAYVFYHLSAELARRWAPELVAERAALTIGLPGVFSLSIHGEVRELGARLAADSSLLQTIRSDGPAAGWARIAADRGPIGTAFHDFLARHGHRLTARDVFYPSWRDAPEVVVALAARSADGPWRAVTADAVERRTHATRTIEEVLGRGPAGSLRRAAFRSSLTAAQRYAVLRENMRYHADYVLARVRDLALALGSQLSAAGRLRTPLDVCFLTVEELHGAVRDGASVGAFAAERRAAFERDAAGSPPAVTLTLAGAAVHEGAAVDEVEARHRPVADAAALPTTALTSAAPASAGPVIAELTPAAPAPVTLTGEVGAPGRCQARARVVRGLADFGSIARGDVLVAAYADPSWTPILELASGLVLEAGGQLSHGAIVARELGIPALVNVAGAMHAIRDGDILLLEATAGRVSIVARGR